MRRFRVTESKSPEYSGRFLNHVEPALAFVEVSLLLSWTEPGSKKVQGSHRCEHTSLKAHTYPVRPLKRIAATVWHKNGRVTAEASQETV